MSYNDYSGFKSGVHPGQMTRDKVWVCRTGIETGRQRFYVRETVFTLVHIYLGTFK